jgi:predicted component of type VI protein secretion system
MFLTKKSLPRRTVLRGLGAAVTLPLLDAMLPAFVPMAKAAAKPRMRFGAVYFPNGAIMQQLTPKTVGAGFEFTPILKPLEPFRDSLIVVTNLTRSHPGSQFGDHAVSAAGFLTGVWPKRTEAEDVLANTTIDQVVARQIGQDTPLPSLEVATEDFTGYVGGCSPGFSCAYLNTISWSTPSTPLPMETNPRAVFERLFGAAGTAADRRERVAKERSILDSVVDEAGSLQQGLGPRDRSRLGDYLDNLREIERRIQRQEARGATQVDAPDAPIGVPDSFDEHVALLFDLLAVAWQSDTTRVFTFMMSRELSQRTYPQIGVTEQHHSVSHHLNKPEKIAQVVKINAYYAGMYAKFLEKLRSTPDGDGSLLDHSLLIYGAGMADSNVHATDPLPMIAIGGGVGTGHRHEKLPTRTPVGNFWLNVAEKFGKPMEKFGDSTGKTDVLV